MNSVLRSTRFSKSLVGIESNIRQLSSFKPGKIVHSQSLTGQENQNQDSPSTDFGSKRAYLLQSIAGETDCAWKLKSGETLETKAQSFGSKRAFALQSIAGEKDCTWKLKSGETLETKAQSFGSKRAFALQSIAGEKDCAWKLKKIEDGPMQKKPYSDLGFLQMAFQEFDTNGDGFLSKQELRNALKSIKISEEDADRIFASIDINSDGSIQLNEWIENVPREVKENLFLHAKEEYFHRFMWGGLRNCDEQWSKLLFGGLDKSVQ